MGKKVSKINHKLHRVKRFSKKVYKKYLGGSPDMALAYTGKPQPPLNNPFLAYTGKGGACPGYLTPNTSIPENMNGMNKTMPSTGPSVGMPTAYTNSGRPQIGGNCSSCSSTFMKGGNKTRKHRSGGNCGSLCSLGYMVGGNHRIGCKCSNCKIKQTGGNPGLPYPAGLVGNPWTPNSKDWPAVDGISGDRNYIGYNNYPTDPQTEMIADGANPPFSIGGKKGSKKQKGGNFSNLFSQDLINLGRQFQYGLGSAYNGLAGYPAPINPMPWKGQIPTTPNLSTVKAAYLY
jgi:hypothetical protein